MNKNLKAALMICSLTALPLISSAKNPVGNTFTIEENYTGSGGVIVNEDGHTVSNLVLPEEAVGKTFTVEEKNSGVGYVLVDEQGNTVSPNVIAKKAKIGGR